MSRRRNRHRSLSNSSRNSERSRPNTSEKHDLIVRSTAQSFYMAPQTDRPINYELYQSNKLYNKNIAYFRQNFNQNDKSQLPFMSSLRQSQTFLPRGSKTTCMPFEAALKSTSNQIIKKKISDFSGKQIRLSTAYYRWHNRSGMNNKWATDFECSLRDYGEDKKNKQLEFYPYVKPIAYQDVEPMSYEQSSLICTKRNKSFNIR